MQAYSGASLRVDLIGGMGSGHYTAYAKHVDGRWYHFNDSTVSPIDESKLRTSASYVLFYRRRDVDFDGLQGDCDALRVLIHGCICSQLMQVMCALPTDPVMASVPSASSAIFTSKDGVPAADDFGVEADECVVDEFLDTEAVLYTMA